MILVIDEQGGKLSRTLVENIKRCFPDVLVLAVRINAQATSAMLHGETDQVTIGENPVIVACRKADVIVGPVGIALADAMSGEVLLTMANTVSSSAAHRILTPMNLCDTYVAGIN